MWLWSVMLLHMAECIDDEQVSIDFKNDVEICRHLTGNSNSSK